MLDTATELPLWVAAYLLALFIGSLVCAVRDFNQDRLQERVWLPPWNATWVEFALLLWFCVAAAFGMQLGALIVLKAVGIEDESWTMAVGGLAMQFGILFAIGIAMRKLPLMQHMSFSTSRLTFGQSAQTGGNYFLAAIPLILLTGLFWVELLQLLETFAGIPMPDEQELVQYFAEAKVGPQLLLYGFMAVVMAPVVEELFFRGLIYRFLATKVSRHVGLVVSSLFFAAIHANAFSFLQLFLLGLLLARAYEKSRSLSVPIAMHAVFNLNSVVLLVALG